MCLCYLFSAKNCMTTSESKGRFFTKRIDSHNESVRIANWNGNALLVTLHAVYRTLVQVFIKLNYLCHSILYSNKFIN